MHAALLLATFAVSIAFAAAGQAVAQTTTRATNLKSFHGIEEPAVRYLVQEDRFVRDDFVNITDVGNGTVRFTLRYRPDEWWDGDRTTRSKDRQRAEIKGLGPIQKSGETFEYEFTWRSNDALAGTRRFCHVFQVKSTDGDSGPPLVVLSIHEGTNSASVRYCSGRQSGFTVARRFTWKPGEWQTVRIRLTTSTGRDGELLASIDGDDFQGVSGVPMFRPDATNYRPKWGLYRGADRNLPLADAWIEHKDVSVTRN